MTGRHTTQVQIKKFAREVVKNGGNYTQAMLATKPLKYESARASGHRLMKRDDVKAEIKLALDANGVDATWLVDKRKRLINLGMDQAENGVGLVHKRGKNKGKFVVRVSPGDVNKHLSGIENLLGALDSSGLSDKISTSHLHLHLENKTHKEIIDERNKHNDWFNDVLDGEDGGS